VPDTVGALLRRVRAGAGRSRLSDTGLDAPAAIGLQSPAFSDGGAIPQKHAGKGVGDNVSPPLRWTAPPAGTRQLVLVFEDIDVPLPRPLLHTIAMIEPGVDHLDEGGLAPETPGLRFVRTMLGRGYLGPRPIPGHGAHHYRFHLLALARPVPDTVSTASAVLAAMRGQVLARGTLTGTYQR
jgi:phosphatidylethanolamine-binding protein (PEBP) family uncharacterized protein